MAPPRVAAAPVSLECKVTQVVQIDDGPNIVTFGRVVGVHLDEAAIVDGRVDLTRLKPIARCGYRGDYTVVESLFEMLRPYAEIRFVGAHRSSAVVSALMFVEAAGAVLVFGGLACVASAIAGRRSWLVAALFAAALGAAAADAFGAGPAFHAIACALGFAGALGDGARAARQAAADDVAGLRHGRVRGGRALGHDRGGVGGDAGRERRRRRAGPRPLAGERGARRARWWG